MERDKTLYVARRIDQGLLLSAFAGWHVHTKSKLLHQVQETLHSSQTKVPCFTQLIPRNFVYFSLELMFKLVGQVNCLKETVAKQGKEIQAFQKKVHLVDADYTVLLQAFSKAKDNMKLLHSLPILSTESVWIACESKPPHSPFPRTNYRMVVLNLSMNSEHQKTSNDALPLIDCLVMYGGQTKCEWHNDVWVWSPNPGGTEEQSVLQSPVKSHIQPPDQWQSSDFTQGFPAFKGVGVDALVIWMGSASFLAKILQWQKLQAINLLFAEALVRLSAMFM